jgi:hypothetical protein
MSTHNELTMRCRILAALILLASGLGYGSVARAGDDGSWKPAPYTLGQGLYFPQQGLRIGGYANLQYYDVGGLPSTLRFRDTSLFITKDIGTRWQLFSEVDAGNSLSLAGHSSGEDSELDIERLYLDYHADQAITFRFGKFLTPVGQWNLIHADPLTWTVSRPLSTSAAFARHASGVMAFGTVPLHGRDLDYWVFADDSKNLGIGQEQDKVFSSFGANGSLRNNFRQAFGGQLLYHMLDDRLSLGISYLDYTLQSPHQRFQLVGMDFSWTARYVNLTGEAIHRTSSDAATPTQQGGFLQAALPLWRQFYLVGRYERYLTSVSGRVTTLRTIGFNFRPVQGIVLKVEHREGNRDAGLAPPGWMASAAVLF